MRRINGAATVLVAALLLSSCIPDTTGGTSAVRIPTPVAGVRPGGTLIVATTPPGGIDPTNATDPAARLIVSTLCDTLIALDPVTGRPKPAIAQSWTIADRGRTLYVRLRKGVRFHNGRELVAEDVAFTLSRLASEDYASDAATLMRSVAGYELIHGDAETDDDRFRRRLAGIQIIDPLNLQISLSESNADWYLTLAHPATAPLAREEVEGDQEGFASRPVCAGPYRLSAPWTKGSPLRLDRFAGYYAKNTAWTRGGAGWAEQIEFRPFDDPAAAERAVASSAADVAHRGEDGPAPGGVRELVAAGSQIELIGVPLTTAPFDDPAVREALSLAIDRAAVARDVYGEARMPLRSFVPPALAGTHRVAPCPGVEPEAQPDRARAALSRAGVDLRGVTVQFFFNDEFRNRALVEAVAASWRATFGLQAEPVPLTWGRFLELGTRPAGFEGAFRFGWAPDVASPDRMLAPLFHVDGIGRDNLSRFGSRDFTDPIREARRSVEEDDRLGEYRRAEDALCRLLPMIPVVVAARRIVLGPRVLAATAASPVQRVDAEIALRELSIRG